MASFSQVSSHIHGQIGETFQKFLHIYNKDNYSYFTVRNHQKDKSMDSLGPITEDMDVELYNEKEMSTSQQAMSCLHTLQITVYSIHSQGICSVLLLTFDPYLNGLISFCPKCSIGDVYPLSADALGSFLSTCSSL